MTTYETIQRILNRTKPIKEHDKGDEELALIDAITNYFVKHGYDRTCQELTSCLLTIMNNHNRVDEIIDQLFND